VHREPRPLLDGARAWTSLVADATDWPVRVRRLVPVLAMIAGAFAEGALSRW
jgi:hypothetical protein